MDLIRKECESQPNDKNEHSCDSLYVTMEVNYGIAMASYSMNEAINNLNKLNLKHHTKELQY